MGRQQSRAQASRRPARGRPTPLISEEPDYYADFDELEPVWKALGPMLEALGSPTPDQPTDRSAHIPEAKVTLLRPIAVAGVGRQTAWKVSCVAPSGAPHRRA